MKIHTSNCPSVMLISFFMATLFVQGAEIEWATVANPKNSPDPSTGAKHGAVDYVFQISKHEVTNAQYAEFLNKVDPDGANPNAIYNPMMAENVSGGIILNLAATKGKRYEPKPNMHDKPVNFVSWFDAARFVNWLHNGRGLVDTETGAYVLKEDQPAPRNPGAKYAIASDNEWYKTAYYDPTPGASGDQYWRFPTRNDDPPDPAEAAPNGDVSNAGPNVANYRRGEDGAKWNGIEQNVTTVGSAVTTSFYGVFDLGGNVTERTEQSISRGGAFPWPLINLDAKTLNTLKPGMEMVQVGFRIVRLKDDSKQ